jgi:hypothetical protein
VTAQSSRSRHRSARVVRRNDDDHRQASLQIAKLHFVGGRLRVSSSSASRSGSVAVVAMSRSPHGIHSGSSWARIRFSARFRLADRPSSSVLLSVNERTRVGPVRNRVLSGFAQDPRPLRSRVVQRNVHARTTALDKDGDNACQRQSSATHVRPTARTKPRLRKKVVEGATDLRPKTA